MTALRSEAADPTLDPEGWRAAALCASPEYDPEIWFPPTGDGRAFRRARSLCNLDCTVTAACLADALARRDYKHGVVGGVGPVSRAQMLGLRL